MKNQWDIIEEKILYDHGIVSFKEQKCYHTKKDVRHDFFKMEFLDWVNIIPLTPDEELILVKQYRFGTEELTLELPGGTLDDGESVPQLAAERELSEETGYKSQELFPLGKVAVNPAIQNNYCHFYLAQEVVKEQEQELDNSEDIEVISISWEEADELIASGEINHSLTILGILYAQRYFR
ncbi:MAG: NUDIX hydrolase [Halanaerobacter sp.]